MTKVMPFSAIKEATPAQRRQALAAKMAERASGRAQKIATIDSQLNKVYSAFKASGAKFKRASVSKTVSDMHKLIANLRTASANTLNDLHHCVQAGLKTDALQTQLESLSALTVKAQQLAVVASASLKPADQKTMTAAELAKVEGRVAKPVKAEPTMPTPSTVVTDVVDAGEQSADLYPTFGDVMVDPEPEEISDISEDPNTVIEERRSPTTTAARSRKAEDVTLEGESMVDGEELTVEPEVADALEAVTEVIEDAQEVLEDAQQTLSEVGDIEIPNSDIDQALSDEILSDDLVQLDGEGSPVAATASNRKTAMLRRASAMSRQPSAPTDQLSQLITADMFGGKL